MAALAFEPRAFWEVKRVDAVGATNVRDQIVVFDQRHFYNDQRWPITITSVSFAAIDYVLKRFSRPGGPAPLGFAAASNIFRPRITISMRGRTSFSKQPYAVVNYANTATADRTRPTLSSVYGYCYYELQKPMELPADATVMFDLSVFRGVPAGAGVGHLKWATAFHEKLYRDIRLGEARTFGGLLHTSATGTTGPFGAPISPFALVPGNDPTNALFPPDQQITPRDFVRQSPIGSNDPVETRVSKFTGISVAIDQLGYDDVVETTSGFPACPLSLRLGVRARTRAGGSQTDWWRPGAPLALVMPTITPAAVYTLEKPITLAPGDQAEIEMTVPTEQPVFTPAPVFVPATYQIGVALNGYAAIEA